MESEGNEIGIREVPSRELMEALDSFIPSTGTRC